MAQTTLKKYKKKFKCPYCEFKFDREKLSRHIDKYHQDMIPEGYTAARVAFNSINKKETGRCIICHNPSPWNEDKQRYERLCGSKKCHDQYLQMCENRMKAKYNGKTKEDFLNDPKFQDKMLKGRSISGDYKFTDGGVLPYVGSYEKNFLEFMDKFLHVKSEDIQAPGPTIEYFYQGKKHFWITDFYYIPYNLVLDIKDGGKNPNNREMDTYREKQIEKEKAIQKTNKFNYLRLTDNQFDQLLDMILELKESMIDLDVSMGVGSVDSFLIKINESSVEDNPPTVDNYRLTTVLSEAMHNPGIYENGDISVIENEFYDMSVKEAKENLLYLEAEMQMLVERTDNYFKVLEGGKPSYDFHYDCLMLKKYDITMEQMHELYQNLDKLRQDIYFAEESNENLFDQIYLNEVTSNIDPKKALDMVLSAMKKGSENKDTLIKGYAKLVREKCVFDLKKYAGENDYKKFIDKSIPKAKMRIGEITNLKSMIGKEIKLDENNSYPIEKDTNAIGLFNDAFLNLILQYASKSIFDSGYDINIHSEFGKYFIYFKRK